MEKLKLTLDALEVTTFAVEKTAGRVHGMEAVTQLYGCGHTAEAGCYASKYCTGPGCIATAAYTCETANNSPC